MTSKPNIIVIMTDQQRYDTLGINGNEKIKTPNLDRLGKEGVVFDRCYCASPECVPARITLKTGLLPWKSGSTNNFEGISSETPTLMKILSENGYYTQAIGKMHFIPTREPFGFQRMWLSEELNTVEQDEFLQDLVKEGYSYVEEIHGMRSYLYYIPQVSQLPAHLHTTAWTGGKSIEYIKEMHQKNQPFFLWMSFIKPHPPFDPPVPYNRMYEPTEMDDPIIMEEREAEKNYTYWNYYQNRGKWMESMRSPIFLRIMRAFYYASVSFVDEQIGKLLNTLEELGIREETMIIFVSDHGEYLGDYWCFGKRGFHDSAARIPFIISYRGKIVEGERRENLIGHADIMPTILDYCGIKYEGEQCGESLKRIIENKEEKWREYFVGQFHRKEKGLYLIMDKEWKYIYEAGTGKEFLYNYKEDKEEKENRALYGGYKEEKERLRIELIEYFEKEGNKEAVRGGEFIKYNNEEYEEIKRLYEDKYSKSKKIRYYQFHFWNKDLLK